MSLKAKQPAGPLSTESVARTSTTSTSSDPFILTLCSLTAPVSIRPPQSPHLRPFTFFTSRSTRPDGSERLHLHMGFFATLEQAEKWAQLMRRAYPDAAAMRAPAALLQKRDSAAPLLPAAAPVSPELTDTQVLGVLETRRGTPVAEDANAKDTAGISLLRPDDTDTRRALKEAVVRGAPVSFAVQLCWSGQPIDLTSIPSLSIFRAYQLYSTEAHRNGRTWYSLRLGFFDDAISAKQVAYYVRSSFASVAVVPIAEAERGHADGRRIDPAALAPPGQAKDSFQERLDQALDSSRANTSPAKTTTAGTGSHRAVEPTSSSRPPSSNSKPARAQSLEETLEMLAASEVWNDADSLSETGVRHLKVDVLKRSSR